MSESALHHQLIAHGGPSDAEAFWNKHQAKIQKVMGMDRDAFLFAWGKHSPSALANLQKILDSAHSEYGPHPRVPGVVKMAELDIVYLAEQIGENPSELLQIYRRAQPEQQSFHRHRGGTAASGAAFRRKFLPAARDEQ